MKIYIVTRKDYDLKWAEHGKELVNINKMAKKIKSAGIDKKGTKIITSPFKDDIEPAKILGKKLFINKVETSNWLVFTEDLEEKLPNILSELIGTTFEENIVIVACRAVVAALRKAFRELGINEKDLNDELYSIETN